MGSINSWCCPCFDCFINEISYCANGCEGETRCCGVCTTGSRKPFDHFKGEDDTNDFGMIFFNFVVSIIWKIDGSPEVIIPNPSKEEKKKKKGIIYSLSDLIDEAENGDIIVSGSNDIFCKEISGLTKSNLAHVMIVIEEKNGKMCYQATINDYLNGCGAHTLEHVMYDAAKYPCWCFLIKLSNESRVTFGKNMENVMTYLDKYSNLYICGKKKPRRYDLANNIRLRWAIKQYNKDPDDLKKVKRYVQVNNHTYGNCSEYVAGAYIAGGLIKKDINSSLITPENICWTDIFSHYYQITFGKMLNNDHAKYLQNFSCIDKEDYHYVVNSFCITPPLSTNI